MRREARETAREAARRSGVPLGEWLNQAIIESAIDDGVVPAHLDEDEPDTDPFPFAAMNGRLDELTQQLERLRQVTTQVPTAAPLAPQPAARDDLTSQRLADTIGRLDGRLDQLIHEGRAATDEIERRVNAVDRTLASLTRETPPPPPPVMAPPFMEPPVMRQPVASPTMKAPPAPLAPPTRPYGPNFLDQAIAEITARQRALDAQPTYTPPPPAPAFVPDAYAPQVSAPPLQPSYTDPVPRSPSQDMSGLEQQLRHITSQIETLRRPPPSSGIEEAIGALRADLAEIARTLTDALPRRAVESLEGEVRALSARVDESRHTGVDTSTLSGIERGLAEVRDALRGLTPAESLVGLGSAVNALSQKIDLISSTHHDPGALAQLEGAISGLRGIVTHVASNDSLTRLQDEVRGLAAKIDRVTSQVADQTGSSDTLNMLEQRIASLADAMESRNQGGELVPPQYDAIVKSLVDKIEKVQLSRGDHMALGHLENRIAQLVERLDASDQRFGHLESIERGLVDLLVHLEEMRAATGASAIRSAPDTKPPVVEALKQDIAVLQATTQEKLEDVHGTIEKVVDRLAMIESGMRSQPQPPHTPPSPPSPSQPRHQPQTSVAPPPPMPAASQLESAPIRAQQAAPQPAPLAPAPLPPPTRAPASAPQATPQHVAPPHVASPRPPIDPNLPPDHPLEPGSRGRPSGSPAERIADSEAALGPAKPPVIADPAGRSNFIAAARRAAQAAAAEMPDRPAYRNEPGFAPATAAGDSEPLSKSLSSRVKMMFSGAGIVLLAFGTTYAVSTMLSEPDFDRAAELTEPAPPRRQAALPDVPFITATPSKPFEAAPLPSAGTLSGGRTNNLPSAGVLSMAAPPAAPVQVSPVQVSPAQVAASAPRTRPPAASDVTGSVPLAPHAVAAPTPGIMPPSMVPPITMSPSVVSPTVMPSVTAAQTPADEPPAAIGGATLRTAALKGDAAASYEVAVRFADGTGVPQDYAQAAVWFERAANQGLAPAQFRLGSLYEKGQGVKKDLATARKLYVLAADQGNAKAMHNLAVLHAEGIEGKPDYKAAAGWFRKAADRDVSDSQYNLGILYARGIGIEPNLTESYKWFSLAARQGDKEAARKRDDVANRLDPQSLMAAKLAVQTWTAEPQPDAAVNVKAPPGGWERPSATAPAKSKARAAARPVPRQEASLAH